MGVPTSYQKVVTSTNYDATQSAIFLRFDGVDDYMSLPYMGLYANGSASVVMARDSLPKTGGWVLLGESNTTTDAPVYWVDSSTTGLSSGAFIRNNSGALVLDNRNAIGTPPYLLVDSSVDTGSNFTKYINSASRINSGYTRADTLTLNNTTIGALVRTTTSGYYLGSLYGLIITKSPLSDADRRKCEVYLGRKAGVQL